VFFEKIFLLLIQPKSPTYPRRLVPPEGRLAIVTDAGRDAVDAKALQTKALIADGEVVWFWRLDAGVKLVEEIPQATVTNKPDHREEHEGNR
jgi:hypothetical protein